MYYVYSLLDPKTSQPFYVGKGSGRRVYRHLTESLDKSTNKMRWHKINQIRNSGNEPTISFIKYFEKEQDALDFEREQIVLYGRKVNNSGILTNFHEGGGQPPAGKGNSEWSQTNPSTTFKGVSYDERYGEEKSRRIKLKRSASLKNRTFSEKTKQQMAKSAKQRTDRAYQTKQVMTPEGIFQSMTEAALHFKVSRGTMTHRVSKPSNGYYLI